MENWNTLLGIVASVFSIIGTIVSWMNRTEIQKINNQLSNNYMFSNGKGNKQIGGNGSMGNSSIRNGGNNQVTGNGNTQIVGNDNKIKS